MIRPTEIQCFLGQSHEKWNKKIILYNWNEVFYSSEQFHNNTRSDQLKSNAFFGEPYEKWNKKIILYEQWVILKTFIEEQFKKISNQTNFDALTHKCVFEFIPKCLWFNIPNFQTLPCIIHLNISKQGFKMLKCFMVQNATKFCIWGAQILKTLKLPIMLGNSQNYVQNYPKLSIMLGTSQNYAQNYPNLSIMLGTSQNYAQNYPNLSIMLGSSKKLCTELPNAFYHAGQFTKFCTELPKGFYHAGQLRKFYTDLP